MTRITIIDYDMGNLHSVAKALERTGATVTISDRPDQIWQADGVVLPGVGAFDPAIQHLRSRDLISPIRDLVASQKPLLGICLGLQVLFGGSDEGREPGLGILPGWVRRFTPEPGLTVPHMGWNQLHWHQVHPISQGLGEGTWAYFVHSFYAVPEDEGVIAATVTHGQQRVTAAIAQGSLIATQFHPEKSAEGGLRLLSNFVQLVQGSATPAIAASGR